jgi:signal transduction histidine kinase
LLLLALMALGWGAAQNRALVRVNRALADTRAQLARETENERRRIARDLHDQTLFDLRRLLMGEAAASGPGFRGAVEAISQEIRRICEDLSPSVLENVGLTAALEWALLDGVAHLPREPAVQARFECSDELESQLGFDAGERIQIYRMVQEAIANACRHAQARCLVLRLAREGRWFVATLEDDGIGFDPIRARAGRGLGNIRSRASLIEARVDWQPRPGGGTVFRLRKTCSGDQSPAASRSASST